MVLSPTLRMWQGILDSTPRDSWIKKFFTHYRGSKVLVALSALLTFLSFWGCISNSLPYGQYFMSVGLYSGTWIQAFFAFRGASCKSAIAQLLNVALKIENVADEESKVHLAIVSRRMVAARKIILCYYIVLFIGGTFPALWENRPIFPIWPTPKETMWLSFVQMVQAVALGSALVAYADLLPLMICVASAGSALYHTLGKVVHRAYGQVALSDAGKLHQELANACSSLGREIRTVLVHYMTACFGVPICSFLAITSGEPSVTVVQTGPAIGFLIPLSVTGQMLITNSGDLGFACYSGPWLFEKKTKTLRMLMMLRATKPSALSLYGMQYLDQPMLLSIFRAWFNCFQVLVNLSHK